MRKVLRVIACLITFCYPLHTYAQIDKGPTYTINGKIIGVDSGKIYRFSPEMVALDSAAIVNGKFTLAGKLDLPHRKSFMIKPGNWRFFAFVDAPRITFNIDTTGAQHQYSNGKDYPIIWQINETGSAMADVYDRYQRETGVVDFFTFTKKLRLANKDSVQYISVKIDSLRKVLPLKVKHWVENYIRQYPSSIAGVYIFREYIGESGENSPSYLRATLDQFSGAAKASVYYQALEDKLMQLEKIQASKPAPDFTLSKRDKKSFKLSTTRGSVVLLDFWASWCVPCRAAIPEWKKVYAKYHAKGFDIIGISGDQKWSNWVKALDIEKMPWPQVIDKFPTQTSKSIVSELYGVSSFPYYVLIDRNGEVLLASGDDEIMAKKIEEVFE